MLNEARSEMIGMLVASPDLERAAADADLVIEAVPERMDLKVEVLGRVKGAAPERALFGTNTSSLSITELGRRLGAGARTIGLHFFNPPPVMALVEVVHGVRTSGAVLDAAVELMRAWGKTPVRCASTPGFIVNRVARPFYGEAQRMAEAGVADPATIDWILRERGGFPMGPFELTDFIGQDVNLAVGTSVWEQTDHDERYAPTEFQRRLVASGKLGRKSGEGVYPYAADGVPVGADPDLGLARRLVGGPIETNPLARTVSSMAAVKSAGL